ncbi:MAG: N-acetylmuramoyl-L-alanine amidase, partial [Oscillospiraceae bacterium]|nr:N-acetylmuramoyl-L-alanine amidase [Oscillospiraceae bacterium]
RSQDNAHFELFSGGFIPVGHVEIIEGTSLDVGTLLTGMSLNTGAKSETVTFRGNGKPFYDIRFNDNALTVTLHNSNGAPAGSVSGSRLFSSVSAHNQNNRTTYTFNFNNRGRFWGYNVTFDDDGNTMLELRYKPALSRDPQRPFEGLVVLLDPGHGGTDPGALGLTGEAGPWESTVNLAHTYAIRDRLAAMGASVYLTRDQNTFVTLDDRMQAIEAISADLFISVHHNAVAESVNANTVSGIETYYHNGTSKPVAETLQRALVTATGRRDRGAKYSYYRVTLMPHSPALLLELGFMSNPLEYERATTPSQIEAVANAVANGIRNALA